MPRRLLAGLVRIVTLPLRLALMGLTKALNRPSHVAGQIVRSLLVLPAFLFRATRATVRKFTP